MQDTWLLHRSIGDNIRRGRPEASEADAIDAAKRAEAHDFIPGLEDWVGRRGYDSEAEAAIQASLDRLMAGRTVIAIAHRLSTVARMDRW